MKTRGRPLCSTQGNDTRRRAIAKASAHSFGKLGYDKTTIRGEAEKAGVDPKWVMHYFGSKERLFLPTIPMPINPVATGRLLRLVPRSVWGQSLPRYFFRGRARWPPPGRSGPYSRCGIRTHGRAAFLLPLWRVFHSDFPQPGRRPSGVSRGDGQLVVRGFHLHLTRCRS